MNSMPEPSTMTSYRVHEFGGPEVIKREELPLVSPGPGDLRVRVKAVGVGPWDGWIRSGNSALPQPLPLTLGSDYSGIVDAVGPEVRGFKRGDAVYGVTNERFIGAYSDYAIAKASMSALKPITIGDVEAASVPVIAVTAKQALFQHAHLTAGQTVLIHGAAGSVGVFAVQLARKAKLKVIATCAANDVEFVRRLGATVVIDYNSQKFDTEVSQVDAVIDLVGCETQVRSFGVIKRGGYLISAVSKPNEEVAKELAIQAKFFLVAVTTAELVDIAAAIDNGEFETKVGTVLPLSKAVEAHEMLEGRRPRGKGKIVMTVD
nr:NADP-dependent oxidoreductase [Rhizobium lusitanum]